MKTYFGAIKLALPFMMILTNALNMWAQEEEPTPYYLNFNVSTQFVHGIRGNTIALQYNDKYGQWKELPLTIYNWKREKVAELNLGKTFGVNNFIINLSEWSGSLELNKAFSLVAIDERNHKLEALIKILPKPEDGPDVNIVVNPIHFKCDELSSKLIDFYADIKGGKAPYTTQWFVLNNQRDDLLYQPREEVIPTSGKTMVVSVDKAPDYYVILYVTDACGNKIEKTIHVVCDDADKKINTLFIEPVKRNIFLNAPKN